MMTNEQVYSLAIKHLLSIEIPERAKYIRSKSTVDPHHKIVLKFR
jgi:NADH:ubiquinone oxidoreductase subunit D